MGWDDCLDELEAQLDHLDPRVGGGAGATDEDQVTWTPPVALGPLPASHRARAEALLLRLHAVAGVLEAARGGLVDDLRDERVRRDAVRSYATDGAAHG